MRGKAKSTNTPTSGLVSVSASLFLMSLATEKKTCSTFKFVFALYTTRNFRKNMSASEWQWLDNHKMNQYLNTVSKNLMPYSSASACPLAVGTAWKRMQLCKLEITLHFKIWRATQRSLPFCFHPYQPYFQPIFY